ncbi:MAG: tRNA (N6-threonylcarbamoyladenosine(37)-N6)-methyltransferase TrmO [Spirochaetales bacterium]|nr:tRNA (N6-threonylcarbamoyladenosine(37)-N6)-methyltransferase TrmO [Spirochaetales bacterium]
MVEIREIGIVKNQYKEPADPFEMRKTESLIEIYEEFSEGLYDIESNSYLQILFHFNRSETYNLKGRWYHGDEKGVFACRSPHRPGAIGLTTVKLVERNGNLLRVKGLDALDKTPVLDIKPFFAEVDRPDGAENIYIDFQKKYPRSSLTSLIKNRNMTALLLETGKLHGHYCPGSALGVAATVYGLHAFASKHGISVAALQASDGMEELLAIIEINSCFADGVQFVSGCTLGNNGLIYRDIGKTSVTFCTRSGKGVRVAVKKNYSEVIKKIDPDFYPLFQKCVVEHSREPEVLKAFKESARNVSFKLVESVQEDLFALTEIEVNLPDYAPICESVVCKSCAKTDYSILDGTGIRKEAL